MKEQPYIHPSFPQPQDNEQILWRYMDSEKFEWMVNYGRLFMVTADNLSDPLEATTPPGYIAWWEREAENATSDEQRATIEHNRNFFAHMVPLFRSRFYVSCWHMNSHENYAMWRCYTNSQEAVAIRTKYSTMRASFPAEIYMGTIRYIDYSLDKLPWGNIFEYIMHKDVAYKYEEEFRIVAIPPATEELGLGKFRADHFSLASNSKFKVYAPKIDVSSIIHGIILHPDASDEFAAKIHRICAAKGLPAPSLSREKNKPVF